MFSLFVLYLVPWICAVAREHERHLAILALTLLTGWTGIGWLAALVWALRTDASPSKHRTPPPHLELIHGDATVRRPNAGGRPRVRVIRGQPGPRSGAARAR